MKTQKIQFIEIKAIQKKNILSIESNIILIQINGNPPKPPQPKKELYIQKNIITFEIIQNKKYIYEIAKNIINIEIKGQQIKKKNPEILFKKVDNFINVNDKVHSKKN